MILKRLYDLAHRKHLVDDPAFETQPVPFVIKVAQNGEFLGIEERRGTTVIPTKKGPSKTKLDKGKELLVPRAHGNTANPGFARFFVDTLARVLPISDEPKSVASRNTFWAQIDEAAGVTGDDALLAARTFGQSLDGMAADVQKALAQFKPGPGDRCTLALHADAGATLVERDAVRQFWRSHFQSLNQQRQSEGPQGLCQITASMSAIATTHATKIQGIPGGIASGVSLISNDKDAFKSYGLPDAANACISWDAADAYSRALIALVSNRLPGAAARSCMRLGDIAVLFWTRTDVDGEDVVGLMENPDPAAVERLLSSASGGRLGEAIEPNDFYCLMISGNSARAVVRDYLEQPLPRLRENLAKWFQHLRIFDPFKKEISSLFPLWMLSATTVRRGDDVLPAVPTQLLDAALKASPVPDSILGACIRRLHVEGSDGFTAARIALIKLALIRMNLQGATVSESLDSSRDDPAYLCGRLMATFEYIQWAAMGDVNATIVDRFYGTASTAPALVFPRFFKSAEQHLSKLHGEKPGWATNLQKDLEGVCKRLQGFPSLLNLAQQGQFALGFYHQRADYRAGRAKAEKPESQTSPTNRKENTNE